MPNTLTCPGCGAPRTEADADRCDHCGRLRPEFDAPPTGEGGGGRFGDLSARFRALEKLPMRARKRTRRPSGFGPLFESGMRAAVGVVFTIVAIGIGAGGPGGMFLVVALLFAAVGIGTAVGGAGRVRRYVAAPSRRVPALVVGKRVEPYRRNQGVHRYVTLQFENGEREEFRASGRILGIASEGDLGYAWTRAEWLLDFDVAPV